MGLDDTVNLERIATALTRLAAAFDQYNIICRERLNREFPREKAKRAPEIINTESERREQFSDKPTDEWLRETLAATPETSRFQKRFDESPNKQPEQAPRKRRAVTVPEVQ